MNQLHHLIYTILLCALCAGCGSDTSESSIDWVSSIPLAVERAESGQRLFVFFRADWCNICKRMEQETLSHPAVLRALEGFVPVKIDVDLQPLTAEAKGVGAVPAIAIMDIGGDLVGRGIGFLEKEDLLGLLRDTISPAQLEDVHGAEESSISHGVKGENAVP